MRILASLPDGNLFAFLPSTPPPRDPRLPPPSTSPPILVPKYPQKNKNPNLNPIRPSSSLTVIHATTSPSIRESSHQMATAVLPSVIPAYPIGYRGLHSSSNTVTQRLHKQNPWQSANRLSCLSVHP